MEDELGDDEGGLEEAVLLDAIESLELPSTPDLFSKGTGIREGVCVFPPASVCANGGGVNVLGCSCTWEGMTGMVCGVGWWFRLLLNVSEGLISES